MQYDLIAGVSVGFMVVPQGLSYATSAGVPSVFGLYGAFLPCLVYSLMGTSKQLAVGPVAVTSLLISANLQAALPCAAAISNPNVITDPAQIACQAAYNQAVSEEDAIIFKLFLLGSGIVSKPALCLTGCIQSGSDRMLPPSAVSLLHSPTPLDCCLVHASRWQS